MMNLTYTLPINKIPYLEWVNVITRYGTQFNWQSEPLLALQNDQISLGNSIQNNRTIQVNPTLSFSTFYNKFGFIRQNSGRNAKGTKAFFVQLLTSVRNVGGAYTRIEGTYLPGYTPNTDLLGYNFDANAPGWGFLFGSQRDILPRASANGWISSDTLQTNLYTKTFAENISIIANLEPLKGLRIDLTATRVDNYNFSSTTELEYNPQSGNLEPITPYRTGNYSISQIAIHTSFTSHNELFKKFEEQRLIISNKLSEQNINSVKGNPDLFADGYSKEQQDVVINSFLSTYLGKDPDQSSIDRKPRFPIPNWRISYNGLSNIVALQDLFTSINLSHAYQSQYVIAGYNSVIRYTETDGAPSERDINDNFLPKNLYGQVSIIDRFVPLIGVDVRLKNNMSANAEYRKSRDMNFSLQNSQMAMMSEESLIFGLGYRKNNVQLPFGLFADRKWKNDFNFKLDFALNDRKTVVYRSDINEAEVSGGNRSISLNPTLEYTVNQFYNIRLFYNSNSVKPYTSQNYATSYTYFGINLRVLFQ